MRSDSDARRVEKALVAPLLQPYPAYKPSGLKWLPGIPGHWRTERGKWLLKQMKRPVRDTDEVVTCFRDGVVTLRKNRRTEGFTESLQEIGYQGIRAGDLVVHAMDAFAGAIGVSDSEGKGTPVYSVCRSAPYANAHYYAYILREMARSQWIAALATGIRERSSDFRYATLASQRLPLPPLPEQHAIARYLDHADRRIQRYIQAKERLITLLHEARQATIHRVVTRGLDSGVPLKPSGVEWLGDVPAHWEVRRLKHSVALIMGQSPSSNDCSTEPIGHPFLQGCAEFGQHIPKPIQYCRVPPKVSPQSAILLSVRAPVGRLNVADQAYGIGRGLCAVIPQEGLFHTRYALYQFYVLQHGLKLASTGSTYEAVSMGDVGTQPVILPPLPEQHAIAVYLDKATADIDAAIHTARRQVDLMHEYRASLIAHVVTGKLDVRAAEQIGMKMSQP